jgi:hypothetical protein
MVRDVTTRKRSQSFGQRRRGPDALISVAVHLQHPLSCRAPGAGAEEVASDPSWHRARDARDAARHVVRPLRIEAGHLPKGKICLRSLNQGLCNREGRPVTLGHAHSGQLRVVRRGAEHQDRARGRSEETANQSPRDRRRFADHHCRSQRPDPDSRREKKYSPGGPEARIKTGSQ